MATDAPMDLEDLYAVIDLHVVGMGRYDDSSSPDSPSATADLDRDDEVPPSTAPTTDDGRRSPAASGREDVSFVADAPGLVAVAIDDRRAEDDGAAAGPDQIPTGWPPLRMTDLVASVCNTRLRDVQEVHWRCIKKGELSGTEVDLHDCAIHPTVAIQPDDRTTLTSQ